LERTSRQEKLRKPIDLIARIQTPENIEFEYRIAGPFRRIPAFLIDFFVRALLMFCAWILFVTLGSLFSGVAGFGLSFDLMLFLVMVFQFLLQWFYGAFFEAYWNGRTPGKWMTGLRVISVDGRPINLTQAIVRNLLRSADLFPTGIVGMICMSMTERFQRLGDLAAGTMVVWSQSSWVPKKIQFEDPRVTSLSEHIPLSFRMSSTLAKALALYVERRREIPIGRRQDLAQYLARPLLQHFGFREDTSADLLLCALYYREFMNQEAFQADQRRVHAPAPLKETNLTMP
jgi:uncharacterized RDD family membrane protein YckC